MTEIVKPVKSISLPVGKITYTESHDSLKMTVKLSDTSSITVTVTWERSKTKAAYTAASSATIKAIADKWAVILKNNAVSPLSQMVMLQNAALEVLK